MINCSKCPETQACCGIMIFEDEFIENHKNKIQLGYIRIIKDNKLSHIMYDDHRCPFLNRKTRLCEIYEFRPKICRDYGYIEKLQCPYFKKSGNERSKASKTKILRKIDKDLKILEQWTKNKY